jgi:hypothetical protein
MQQIVTGNETWVHHYEPASKCQSMEWKYTSLPRIKKFKSVPSASIVMLRLFQDFNGPIPEHHQDCGQTVNSAQNCAMLAKLKPIIHSKRRGMLTKVVVLHHDIA